MVYQRERSKNRMQLIFNLLIDAARLVASLPSHGKPETLLVVLCASRTMAAAGGSTSQQIRRLWTIERTLGQLVALDSLPLVALRAASLDADNPLFPALGPTSMALSGVSRTK